MPRGNDLTFTLELRPAIDAERPHGIRLCVGASLAPVEHVVGRDVNERHGQRRSSSRDRSGPFCIDRESRGLLGFGLVDGRVGGCVDDHVRR